MPTTSKKVPAELVTLVKRSRFNPIRSLDPVSLASQLDSFEVGRLRDFALTARAIKRRDDVISVALPKREKAVSRRDLIVATREGVTPEQEDAAKAQQDALQYFWNNCETTHALEGDVRGGAKLLVRQMMSAVGFKYAVHEIIWRPVIENGQHRLTATFVHVPLEFFEATQGKLRFLANYLGKTDGEEMKPSEWLVTVGEGIMEPLAVGYMFKQLSLRDWVSYNELFGTPIRIGKTDSGPDSDEWAALKNALDDIGQDFAAVVSNGSAIEFITASNQGTHPFPALVDRMDRALATICRGADLSTMSAGEGSGQGASLQGDESDLLEKDDAELISETLQRIDRIVIKQQFGTEPLVETRIVVPEAEDNADTRANIETAVRLGVPLSVEYIYDRLALPKPEDDAELLTDPYAEQAITGNYPGAPTPTAAPGGAQFQPRRPRQQADRPGLPAPRMQQRLGFANAAEDGRAERFRANALAHLTAAQAKSLQPLTERLERILALDDDQQFTDALHAFRGEIPELFKTLATDDTLATAFEAVLGTALADGAAEAAQSQETAS